MNVFFKSGMIFVGFAIFHSITAQESFKNWLSQYTGHYFISHFWRLLYFLISYVLLFLVFIPGLPVAEKTFNSYKFFVEGKKLAELIYFSGLSLNYLALWQLDFLEFCGLRQAFWGMKSLFIKQSSKYERKTANSYLLDTSGIYKYIRHPQLSGGFLMILSAVYNVSNLFYLALYSVYMLVGAYFEERRLIQNYGESYLEYKKNTGAFWPRLNRIKLPRTKKDGILF